MSEVVVKFTPELVKSLEKSVQMSKAMKKHFADNPEACEVNRQSIANYLKSLTPEQMQERMRNSCRSSEGQRHSAEGCRRYLVSRTDEDRARKSAAHVAQHARMTPEEKQHRGRQISESLGRYNDGLSEEEREERCRRVKAASTLKPSTISLEGVTEEDKQHLTGFFEGDGSLSLFNKRKPHQMRPHLGFSQKDPRILEYIRTLLNLDESIHERSIPYVWKGQQRSGVIHTLEINRRLHVGLLLNILQKRVVCPQRVAQMNRVLGTNVVAEHDVTWAWLAGFIDAEGCFSFNRSPFLSVAQKDVRVLQKIRDFTGTGHIGNYGQMCWSGKNVLEIVNQVYKYLRSPDKKERVYAMSVFLKKEVG